jgi:hypothetical protein
MSVNPEVEEIVTLPLVEHPAVEPPNGHTAVVAVPAPPTARKRRPPWVGSLAVGVVALIASGTLGYVSYAVSQQRNATQAALAATQTELASTKSQLDTANSDAATRLVTAKYVAMYTKDQGKVRWDYQNIMRCNSFGSCRTASQDLMNDLAQFQADRKAANVPVDLVATDRDLGDALSSAYAAAAQIVSGMDNVSFKAIDAGFKKLQAAMLSLAKVESALGGQLSL